MGSFEKHNPRTAQDRGPAARKVIFAFEAEAERVCHYARL